jgi:hypothetical protein
MLMDSLREYVWVSLRVGNFVWVEVNVNDLLVDLLLVGVSEALPLPLPDEVWVKVAEDETLKVGVVVLEMEKDNEMENDFETEDERVDVSELEVVAETEFEIDEVMVVEEEIVSDDLVMEFVIL